ncbi:C40 family peptidase [Streptomyces sp. H27-D2]|uniref:C40 family peptidase n=1 Tax=Streptomyces sp. H27-D2 TaxID=3046304 RepID=UPI002DB61B45|nr:NlpC/P60 family protein [Streptomyces sp. H27-D2]MEC4019315.1 NlpC/P60 family protein [Streptomyces sp. H27-D2]
MPSHSRPRQSGLSRAGRLSVLSAAVATAAAALGAAPALADPKGPDASAGDVKSRVDTLYEQAEAATEKFNAAGERTDTLREQVEHAQDLAARGQERVNRLRAALGIIANAQYRTGGIDPAVQLLLSADPAGYLEKAAALDRVNSRQAGELRELQHAQRVLEQQRGEAALKLEALEAGRKVVAKHKRAVQAKLGRAQRLLDSMAPAEREVYGQASRSGRSGDITMSGLGASSSRAAMAVQAARQAVGSPYGWGQAGPGAFDCSGLTQWAYGRAGVGIPRTSQAQRHAGRQVPLSQARPGDLVVYRDDASHVGMYVGNGQVVHAPYPGARVRYDPVGMMPVSSVSRP